MDCPVRFGRFGLSSAPLSDRSVELDPARSGQPIANIADRRPTAGPRLHQSVLHDLLQDPGMDNAADKWLKLVCGKGRSIQGVDLAIGELATPFDHRSHASPSSKPNWT